MALGNLLPPVVRILHFNTIEWGGGGAIQRQIITQPGNYSTIEIIIKILIIIITSFYAGLKHFNFRLAVINICPVRVPSESFLSTHIPTSEGWIVELTVGL